MYAETKLNWHVRKKPESAPFPLQITFQLTGWTDAWGDEEYSPLLPHELIEFLRGHACPMRVSRIANIIRDGVLRIGSPALALPPLDIIW